MPKKIVLGVLILILLSGITFWLVVNRPLLVASYLLQRATDNGKQPMEVETLLVSAEEDLFAKAGVQKVKEKIEAPDFTLKNLEGQEVSLKQLRGKLVLLNFWATWCGPCRIEKPTLEKLYQEFKDKGLVILAVSIDQGDSLQVVRAYYEKYGYSYGALLDSEMEVARLYGVRAIPASYLIDREGYILGIVLGANLWDKDGARKLITYLLEKSEE